MVAIYVLFYYRIVSWSKLKSLGTDYNDISNKKPYCHKVSHELAILKLVDHDFQQITVGKMLLFEM